MIDSTTKILKHNCVMELNRPCSLMRFCDCGQKPVGIKQGLMRMQNIYIDLSLGVASARKDKSILVRCIMWGNVSFFFA